MIRFNADLYRIATMCQSTEQTRFYLMGVFVEPHAVKGVTLTTTDGHKMLMIHDETGVCDEPAAIIAISAEALKACKAPSKGKYGSTPVRDIVVDGADATVLHIEYPGSDQTESKVAFSSKCRIDGVFPDYRRVIPPQPAFNTDSMPAAFNGGFLALLAKVGIDLAKLAGNSTPLMRVVSSDPVAPALVFWPNVPHAFAVLMPVRADKSHAIPTRFNARPAPVEEKVAALAD